MHEPPGVPDGSPEGQPAGRLDGQHEGETQAGDRGLAPLRRALDQARRGLVAAGQRNRLIHLARDTARSKFIDIVGAGADAVFTQLLRERRKLVFAPAEPDTEASCPCAAPEAETETAEQRLRLRTRLAPDLLQKRVIALQRDARTLEEEQGVNILYLAIGFLRWYEDRKSEVAREAPLILLPVALVRDDAHSTARLVCRDDDIAANLPLQERLRQDFAIALPDLPEGDDWRPHAYFDAVRAAVAPEARWSIDENGMVLGFFSFAKLLMYRDLMPVNWPGEGMLAHPILRGLLTEGFAPEDEPFDEHAALDDLLDPADLVHVVDADASQTLVIETARRGRNLVVQGPPGTGKSQTIANIIAGAAHDGRTMLFVAEKMAALEVVHDRLVKAGLRDLCLELHSRQANKRAVAQELDRTLRHAGEAAAPAGADEVDRLRRVRDRLNRDAARLHATLVPSGVTPYRALGLQVRLAQAGHPPPELDLPAAAGWSEEAFRGIAELVGRLAGLTAQAGALQAHPWAGVAVAALQPTDRQRLERRLPALAEEAGVVAGAVAGVTALLRIGVAATVGLVPPLVDVLRALSRRPAVPAGMLESVAMADLPHVASLADRGCAWLDVERAIAADFVPAALGAEPMSLRAALAAGVGSVWRFLSADYRRASRNLAALVRAPLPRRAADRLALVDRLLRVQELRAALVVEAGFAQAALGVSWRQEQTDFRALAAAVSWLHGLAASPLRPDPACCVAASGDPVALGGLADRLERAAQAMQEHADAVARLLGIDLASAFGTGALSDVPVAALAERAQRWAASCDRLDEWVRLSLAHRLVCDCGAAAVAERLADGRLAAAQAGTELAYARAEALWKAAVRADPELALADGDERSQAVAEFRALETRRRARVAGAIRGLHRGRMPWGGMGEMGVIRGEIGRQRGHMPIRKLMQRAGRTVQQIKPVFLMSPLSVAQFLPPGVVAFDLLVIDEASQVRPEDALGALARAGQIVVVGDKKQLPPTAFFDRLVNGSDDESEDAEAAETPLAGAAAASQLESILALCEARGMPGRMLSWHYRSRHPSLIAVSNDEFYEGRLFLPPSPSAATGEAGLVRHRVAGAYDRGGKRTNEIEARAVVAALQRHAAGGSAAASLGIVTFSVAQRDLIDDLIEHERRRDGALDSLLREKRREPLFVKNLENVQGDERDIVLVSVGYGPRVAGGLLDSLHFGPVSTEGGERRLNVLFTRARLRCEVFVSFDAGDIDLARTTQSGPRVLKRFLRYAETGALDLPAPTGIGAESPFEEAVAQAIAELGYVADAQVGSAGFRIDLAVKDPQRPGRYALAVECDGAAYHGARWARERDRLRQEVLEGLGWSFHRIWSTDWFRRPEAERAKLAAAIERACTAAAIAPPVPEPPAPEPAVPEETPVDRNGDDPRPPVGGVATPYREVVLEIAVLGEPHEAPVELMATLATRIVAAEGPIHEDEVARRVAHVFGKNRTGRRIAEAVWRGLVHAERSRRTIVHDGEFWTAAGAAADERVRDRSAAPATLRRADMLPPAELRNAIRAALKANGGLARDEMPVAAARVLGWHRTGAELRAVIEAEIATMIAAGQLVEAEGTLRLE